MLQGIKNTLIYIVNQIVNIGIFDIIDIIIVTTLFYYIYKFVRDRRASKLAIGIMLILAIMAVSYFLEMHALNFIISNVVQVGIVGVVILFHDELRSFLEKVGGNSIKSVVNKKDVKAVNKISKTVSTIADAVFELSEENTGALIVIERDTKLGDIISTGTIVNAEINTLLIKNIFFNKSPLHDGAMVLRDGKIHAAGCFLPLSQNKALARRLGTRHRAAVGMSENSDAAIVVVSEETGNVSIAFDGAIAKCPHKSNFVLKLKDILIGETGDEPEKSVKEKIKGFLLTVRTQKDAEKKDTSETSEEGHRVDVKRKKVRSLRVKAFCFLAAFVVWFYAVGSQSPAGNKTFSNVPVVIDGLVELEKQGYTVISGNNAIVDVTLMGKRNVLNNLDTEDVSVAADLSGIYSSGEYQVNLKVTAPDKTTLSEVNPESILVVVDRPTQKQISVEPIIVSGGVNDPNLRIESLTSAYPTIRVTGPEKELEKISKAVVDVSLSGLIDKTVDYTGKIYLVDNEGKKYENKFVSCDKSETRVTVLVRKYKTVPVEVVYADKNVNNYAYKIDVDVGEIEISGNADVIDSIASIKTEDIDVSRIVEATTIKAKLHVPPGIYINESDSVTLSIYPQGGTSKEIITSNICVINVEDGVKITIDNNEVEMVFEGDKNSLDLLDSKNIYAIIDASGYTKRGTYEAKLDVVYPNSLSVKLSSDIYCKITVK